MSASSIPHEIHMARTGRELVMLTGSSGVLGNALVRELTDMPLAILYHKQPYPKELRPSWELQCSLTDARLGLGRRGWTELVARTRAVIHCASVTTFNERPKTIGDVNVGGTRNMLQLAHSAEAPLYYLSTAFVTKANIDYPALAGYDDDSPGREAYLRSKRAAEELVRDSGQGVIVRPSVILGDRKTGRIARRQGLHQMLRSFCLNHIPFIPFAESTHIDFLPQDVVAAAIGALVRSGVNDGEFWLTAGPAALRAGELIEICLKELAAVGVRLDAPRFLDSDIIERLIVPAFLDAFPDRERRRYANMLAGASLFSTVPRFETSLPIGGRRDLRPTPDMLRGVLRATIQRYCLPRLPKDNGAPDNLT